MNDRKCSDKNISSHILLTYPQKIAEVLERHHVIAMVTVNNSNLATYIRNKATKCHSNMTVMSRC
jgi:hypothetical protein